MCKYTYKEWLPPVNALFFFFPNLHPWQSVVGLKFQNFVTIYNLQKQLYITLQGTHKLCGS